MIGRKLAHHILTLRAKMIEMSKVMDSLFLQHLQEADEDLRRGPRVVHCPVMILQGDMEGACHHVQLIFGKGGKQNPGHGHRIHRGEIRYDILIPAVLLNESHIKAGIVGHQRRLSDKFQELRKHRLNPRRVHHHLVGNAGQLSDAKRNGHARIHKGAEPVCDLAAFHLHRADFNDLVLDGAESCSLQVEDHIGPVQGLTLLIDRHILEIVHQVAFYPVNDLKGIVFI